MSVFEKGSWLVAQAGPELTLPASVSQVVIKSVRLHPSNCSEEDFEWNTSDLWLIPTNLKFLNSDLTPSRSHQVGLCPL